MSNKEKFHINMSSVANERLVSNMGYCIASNRITVDGLPIGYLYREEPDNEHDSGWRFFAGDEDDDYVNNPENAAIFDVNTLASYAPEIISFLTSPYGSAYGRNEDNQWEEELFEED